MKNKLRKDKLEKMLKTNNQLNLEKGNCFKFENRNLLAYIQ